MEPSPLLERDSIYRPAPVRNFSFPKKKRGPQRKGFGGRYGFPGFYRVFVSTTGLESFSLRPEEFSKRFSFCDSEKKNITHHAFFRKIFRKIGQKSKQQKPHISVAKCRCFKDPARLRLARPISCIFSVGRVHHESLHGGVRKVFTFHPKIASIFHRKMVCVFLSAAGKLVNIFHRKMFPFSSHVV